MSAASCIAVVSSPWTVPSQRRGLTEHIILILLIIGVLAYAIDRLLYWFQLQLFPYQTRQE